MKSLNFIPSAHCFSGDFLGTSSEILFYTMLTGFLLSLFCSMYLIRLCISIPQKNYLVKLSVLQALFDVVFSICFYLEMDARNEDWCMYFAILTAFFVNGSLFSIFLISASTLFEKRSDQQRFEQKLNRNIIYCMSLNVIHCAICFLIIDVQSSAIQFGVGFLMTAILIIGICWLNIRLIFRLKFYDIELEDKTPIVLTSLILFVWIEGIVDQILNMGEVQYEYLFILTAFLQEAVGAVNFIASYRRLKYLKGLCDKNESILTKPHESLTFQMYQVMKDELKDELKIDLEESH